MEERVIDIMAGILKIDRQSLLNNLDSRDVWDSLHRVEIIFAMEEELDIQFSEEELANLLTPQTLLEHVMKGRD